MDKIVNVFKKTGAARQLVMFPFGGGNGFSYMELATVLHNPDIEILLINPPGHMFCEKKPLESITQMVQLYIDHLRPALRDEVVFFGHSMGGIVAYECCRVLEKEKKINHLFISAVNPPGSILDTVNINSRMDDRQIIEASNELGGLRGLTLEDNQFLTSFAAALRADVKALEDYQPDPNARMIKTPATILYSSGDVMKYDQLRHWDRLAPITQFLEFNGNHFYIFKQENKIKICRLLSDSLRRREKNTNMFG